MNLFELFAKLSLDTSEFEKNLGHAKSLASSFGTGVKNIVGGAMKATAAAFAATTTAAVAFGTSAVKTGIEFDASMSQVAATMGKTVDEIKDLRDFAQEMGRTTVFSATQAAEALNYMALAGYDAETSMEMLPTVLDLAAAGGMDLARASDMITDSQSALHLSLDETSALVDQMAKAASKSNTSVEQLGDAILTIGGTADVMAGGTDRLATVLGLLADNGIKGSEAGTHLRNMILKLSAPTEAGANALEKLGLKVFDAEGKMRDFEEIFTDLSAAMESLTDEEKLTITSELFNARDISAVNALLNTSTDRWRELGDAIVDSKDAAAEMASTQLDNLNGDITLLKSAWEGAKIAVSDELTPTVRDFVQFATKGISEITEGFKEGGIEGAIDAFSRILEEGSQKIVEGLPQVIELGGKVFTSLLDGVSNSLPTLTRRLPGMIKKIAPIASKSVKGLIDAFVSLITDDDVIDAAVDGGVELIGAVVSGLFSAAPKLLEAIPKVIGSAFTSIASYIARALESADERKAREAWEKKLESITTLDTEIKARVPVSIDYGEIISKDGRTLSDIESDINSTEDEITRIIKEAMAERGTLRDDEIQQISDYLAKLDDLENEKLSIYQSQQLAELRKIQLDSAEMSEEEAMQYLANAQSLLNEANKVADELYTKDLTRIENMHIEGPEYERMLAEAKERHDEMVAENQKYYDEAFAAVQEASNRYVKDTVDAFGEIGNEFEGLRSLLQTHTWKNMYEDLTEEQLGEIKRWLDMVAQVKASGGEISEETKNMVKIISDAFPNDVLYPNGSELIEQLMKGMEDVFPEMAGKTAEQAFDIFAMEFGVNRFSGGGGGRRFGDIGDDVGKQIDEGVAKGIDENTHKVISSVNRLNRAIRNTLESGLDIHSPSKLTAYFGKMLDEGLELGIRQNEDSVLGSIEDMAKGINGELNNDLTMSGSPGRSIVMNIYGAEGQDVTELAEIVSQKIAFDYDKERRAFA